MPEDEPPTRDLNQTVCGLFHQFSTSNADGLLHRSVLPRFSAVNAFAPSAPEHKQGDMKGMSTICSVIVTLSKAAPMSGIPFHDALGLYSRIPRPDDQVDAELNKACEDSNIGDIVRFGAWAALLRRYGFTNDNIDLGLRLSSCNNVLFANVFHAIYN